MRSGRKSPAEEDRRGRGGLSGLEGGENVGDTAQR